MSDSAASTAFDSGRAYLGSVYAKALFGASEKSGETEAIRTQLESIVVDVLEKLPKFAAALCSLRVKLVDKERMIEHAFASQASRLLVNALKVMVRNGRIDCLREVRGAYQELYNQARGRVEVQVRTAAPINNQLLEQIKQKLAAMLGCEVDVKTKVQPELLGGLVVRVGDKLYDGSLVSQLENLRTRTFEQTEAAIRGSLERFVGA